jgi:hypothetical protein
MKTKEYISNYLKENIIESETLHRMKPVIGEFAARAPKILVTKCIDGRVHGSKAKGYPTTTIRFGRTDGNIVSTAKNNYSFWNRIDSTVNDAICNTPEMPAIFIAYMHKSDKGFGCAAHNNNEEESLKAIQNQTREIQKIFSTDRLYVLQGITNTDLMAETLLFDESIRISSEDLISDFSLNNLTDIFYKGFLKYPIKDPATARFVNFKTPEELMTGNPPLIHSDFQTSLSLKSFLLLEISRIINENDPLSQKLVQPDLFHALLSLLNKVKSLPKTLIPAFFYQMFWNISYAINQKNKLDSMTESEQLKIIDHAEELICYGDGFELSPRNKTILVKTGRGNDIEALQVAKRVLEKNRSKKNPEYSKIIHLNIEVSGEQISWEDFNENISSKLHTMLRPISEIFDQDINILTTYSYRDQKRFYPINTIQDNRIINPVNIIDGINSTLHFSNMGLKSRESLYVTQVLS